LAPLSSIVAIPHASLPIVQVAHRQHDIAIHYSTPRKISSHACIDSHSRLARSRLSTRCLEP
jgi:hypothetical protein